MAVLIGFGLPADMEQEMIAFGERHGYAVRDPHIALLSPSELESIRGIERKLQAFCLAQTPFNTIVGGPGIDDRRILYLTVLPGALSAVREALCAHLGVAAEAAYFKPNLSLVRQQAGEELAFGKIFAEAKRLFSKPRPICVKALSVYRQAHTGAAFTLSDTFALTGR